MKFKGVGGDLGWLGTAILHLSYEVDSSSVKLSISTILNDTIVKCPLTAEM